MLGAKPGNELQGTGMKSPSEKPREWGLRVTIESQGTTK